MLIELSLAEKPTADAAKARPIADNDDDPFDPPPAAAMHAPIVPDIATIVAYGAPEVGMLRAA